MEEGTGRTDTIEEVVAAMEYSRRVTEDKIEPPVKDEHFYERAGKIANPDETDPVELTRIGQEVIERFIEQRQRENAK